jgi:peroxiredoxin
MHANNFYFRWAVFLTAACAAGAQEPKPGAGAAPLNLQAKKAPLSQDGLPEGFRELKIGDPAPPFSLPGIDDRKWSLTDFAAADVLMVFFTSNHCPTSHAAEPRLLALLRELKGRSFQVVAINPNHPEALRVDELGYSKYNDSFAEMKLYAKDQGFTFPYLYDGETQEVAKSYGCLATPHVFLFDKERKLRYKGWLDDSRFADPSTVKRPDAKNAVLALLEGKPVPVDTTRPFGCSTKWRGKQQSVAADNEKWEKAPVSLEKIDAAGVARLAKNETGKFRLINVWATTCLPCVQEFPGLIQASRRMGLRDFELITLSMDDPADLEKARKFLENQRAALPDRLKASLQSEGRTTNNYLYSDASADTLIKALDPEWNGAMPHTVLIGPGGKSLWRHTGQIGPEELLGKILGIMTPYYQPGRN